MGTVTTYNESTGRFEVKDNSGKVIATGNTWREEAERETRKEKERIV